MLCVLIFGWLLLLSHILLLFFIGVGWWNFVIVPPRFMSQSVFRQFPEGNAKGSFWEHFLGFDRCMEGHDFLEAFLKWSEIVVFISLLISFVRKLMVLTVR